MTIGIVFTLNLVSTWSRGLVPRAIAKRNARVSGYELHPDVILLGIPTALNLHQEVLGRHRR